MNNTRTIDTPDMDELMGKNGIPVDELLSATPTITEKEQNKYQKIAKEIAFLVEQKQQAYGDSFGKSGEILRVLYPDGIHPEQYGDMLTIVRVIDKLFRIATDRDAFGESPWKDINGYSLLAIAADRLLKVEG